MCWVPPPSLRIGCMGYLPLTLNLVRKVSVGPPGKFDRCILQLGCVVDWCLTSIREMKTVGDNWESNPRVQLCGCFGCSQSWSWWVEDPGVFLVNRSWAICKRDRDQALVWFILSLCSRATLGGTVRPAETSCRDSWEGNHDWQRERWTYWHRELWMRRSQQYRWKGDQLQVSGGLWSTKSAYDNKQEIFSLLLTQLPWGIRTCSLGGWVGMLGGNQLHCLP